MLTAKSGYVFLMRAFMCEVLDFLQISFMGEGKWWACVLCEGLNQLGSAVQTKSLTFGPQAVLASFLAARVLSRAATNQDLPSWGEDRNMFREGSAAASDESYSVPWNATCVPGFYKKILNKSLILKLFCLHWYAQRSIALSYLLKVNISFFAVSLCTACLVVTFKLL